MNKLLLLLLSALVLTATVSEGLVSCAVGCTPWQSGLPCLRGSRMQLRMALDLSSENYWGTSLWQNASYAFCPSVDSFEVLNLNHAALYTAGAVEKKTVDDVVTYHTSLTTSLPSTSSPHYLSVYGFGYGNESTRWWPPKGNSTGAVEFAVNGIGPCASSSSVAVVNILVLEVGLHRGVFNYVGAIPALTTNTTNELYNETLCAEGQTDACDQFIINTTAPVDGIPAKTGFVPTCKYNPSEEKDICLFDDASPCIGSVIGQKNCGVCYSTSEDDIARMANASTQIFVSYYGTDRKGRALTSGGLNPMNYVSFSGGVFSTISDKLKNIWGDGEKRNMSDYFTNPNFPWN